MSGEPTPPPVISSPDPPPYLQPKPRNPVGWIVSSLLIFLTVVGAVAGYVKGVKPGQDNYLELQDQLKNQVSLKEAQKSPVLKALAAAADITLKRIADQASEDAPRSEMAAKIALAAGYESGGEPDKLAIKRLEASPSETSQLMGKFYAGENVAQRLANSVEDLEQPDFVTRLARVEAMEKLGLPSDRSKLVDSSLALKYVLAEVAGLLGLVLGTLVLVWFLSIRSQGRLKPVGFGGWKKEDGDRLMARFALYFIIFTLVSFAAIKLPDTAWNQAGVLALVGALSIGSVVLPIFGKQDSVKALIGPVKPTGRLIGLGLLGYLAVVPILAIVVIGASWLSKYLPTPHHPINEEILNAGPSDWVAIALTAVIIAPLIEEFFFRGVLLTSLAPNFKRALWPILICGLVFAAIHPQGPLIWPALIAVGASSAYLRYYSGSLVPSFVLHMVHNGIIIFVSMMLG